MLSVADLNFVRADPELNQLLRWYNNYQCDYMALDTMNPPLDNLKLRQALSHAVDRDAMVQVLAGTVEPAYSLLMPGFPAYNPDLKPIQAFDPELARQLLAEAGYPEGRDANGQQLELTITHSAVEAKVEFVQAQWQEHLGIKVNYELVEYAAWSQRRAAHEMQIYKGPYEYDYIDPANFLGLFRSNSEMGSPRHSWLNPEYDALYDEAGHMTDSEARFAKYQEAERILVEDVGAIFLTHMLIYQIFWPYFTGIPKDITGREVYRGLDITFSQVYIRDDIAEWPTPRTT
jgi:ABC-type transport system substrate-binding protein